MQFITYIFATLCVFIACFSCGEQLEKENETSLLTIPTIQNPTNSVLLSSEIKWEKLNPARGDKSPEAGTIWGDRNGTEATGFLAKFKDGFSSPPHIHNVTYRAFVIQGLIHNDDAKAEKMWMGKGSYWTQPQGQSHITASQGESIALVEIDQGPYLVKPVEQAYEKGEKPINIDASNIVWLNGKQLEWIDDEGQVEVSVLDISSDFTRYAVKLPSSFIGKIITEGSVFHAVVADGALQYKLPQNHKIKSLNKGSSFHSTAKAVHTITDTSEKALLYIKTNGKITIK